LKKRKGDKHTFVGNFFEHVGHRILGGELTRDQDGDICLWRTRTSVEVKSSGAHSSYGFRLSVEQIEHYEELSSFPFNRVWYVLFAYRNNRVRRQNGLRFSELSEHENPVSINRYLAGSALWCIILDLSIVSAWKRKFPHSTKSVIGHKGMKTVDIKPRVIHTFSNGGLTEGLKDLDFDPKKFVLLSGKVRTKIEPDLVSEHTIKFPITAILPVSEASSFQRMLLRRGFRLRRVIP